MSTAARVRPGKKLFNVLGFRPCSSFSNINASSSALQGRRSLAVFSSRRARPILFAFLRMLIDWYVRPSIFFAMSVNLRPCLTRSSSLRSSSAVQRLDQGAFPTVECRRKEHFPSQRMPGNRLVFPNGTKSESHVLRRCIEMEEFSQATAPGIIDGSLCRFDTRFA